MSDVGVIAIGRNEGERLRRCLASVAGRGMPVVYVDSASTDGSVDVARGLGAEVVELDMSLPFSAARARNAGFERLVQVAPHVRFAQFVDGDCEVVDGWIERARRELESHPEVAVVCGRRRERHPEASVYNRLADLEWDTPVGEAKSCGGDAMMRVEPFRDAGGFDASIAAGEEPELCQRLREKGHKVFRINAEMTLHDSAMLRFGQWWKRTVRSGYGAMDVATRFGDRGLFVHHVKSARRWTIEWLMTILALMLMMPVWLLIVFPFDRSEESPWPAVGMACVTVIGAGIAVQVLQMLRVAWGARKRAGDRKTALAYGALTMIGKWANVVGQRQYRRDRAAGRNTRLIEYKSSCPTPITRPT